MRCQNIRERLEDYARGDLPAGEKETVEAHLEGCARCREVLSVEQSLVSIGNREPTVPKGFANSVLKAREGQKLTAAYKRKLVFQLGTCSRYVFRVLVDPLLWTGYALNQAFDGLQTGLTGAKATIQRQVFTEMRQEYRQIAATLKLAYQQVYGPLTNNYHIEQGG
jgi:anti-sigma factor RsiW